MTNLSIFKNYYHNEYMLANYNVGCGLPCKLLMKSVVVYILLSRAVLKVRAEKVCDEGKRWQEIQHLRQVFRANGYPEPVVKRNLRGRPTPTNTTIESETPPKHLRLMSEVSVNKARRRADRWE